MVDEKEGEVQRPGEDEEKDRERGTLRLREEEGNRHRKTMERNSGRTLNRDRYTGQVRRGIRGRRRRVRVTRRIETEWHTNVRMENLSGRRRAPANYDLQYIQSRLLSVCTCSVLT